MKHIFLLKRKHPWQLWPERRSVDPQRAHPNPLALFQNTRCHAIKSGQELLRVLDNDLKCGESSYLEYYWERLPFLCNVVKLADEASRLYKENKPEASQEIEPATQTFLISSLFLSECHSYLTGNPKGFERLHLVTGIKLSATRRTLDNMVKVALARETVKDALADHTDLQKTLIEMDERWGHFLYGLFHSHPGTGVSATHPSDTDLKTHERYERGGYPLLGAIFVKDGYCRFFSNQPFNITIYGKGVTQHDEHDFKLMA